MQPDRPKRNRKATTLYTPPKHRVKKRQSMRKPEKPEQCAPGIQVPTKASELWKGLKAKDKQFYVDQSSALHEEYYGQLCDYYSARSRSHPCRCKRSSCPNRTRDLSVTNRDSFNCRVCGFQSTQKFLQCLQCHSIAQSSQPVSAKFDKKPKITPLVFPHEIAPSAEPLQSANDSFPSQFTFRHTDFNSLSGSTIQSSVNPTNSKQMILPKVTYEDHGLSLIPQLYSAPSLRQTVHDIRQQIPIPTPSPSANHSSYTGTSNPRSVPLSQDIEDVTRFADSFPIHLMEQTQFDAPRWITNFHDPISGPSRVNLPYPALTSFEQSDSMASRFEPNIFYNSFPNQQDPNRSNQNPDTTLMRGRSFQGPNGKGRQKQQPYQDSNNYQ